MKTVALFFVIVFCASVEGTEDEDYHGPYEPEGDIKVDGVKSARRNKRGATADESKLWRNGVVPFVIDSVFSGKQRAVLIQAMKHWENHTCLSFIEHTNEKDYVLFYQGNGCFSMIGRQGNGQQEISIGKGCGTLGIVLHEIGHAVGFWHEQSRPDRNKFVTILEDNIEEGEENNFELKSAGEINSRNEPYDYESIMHYRQNSFAKSPNKTTIRTKWDPLQKTFPKIGQRVRLSDGDIRQSVKMYQCAECGRTLQDSSGSFSSPGYPQHYLPNRECEWRISVSPGQRIVVNFTQFNLKQKQITVFGNKVFNSCWFNNYVEIREGRMRTSRRIGRYCGNSRPAPVTSNSNHLWVKFKSGSTSNGSVGFEATYKAICGGKLENFRGSIQSPSYPENYPSKSSCMWKISIPSVFKVGIRFHAFDLESQGINTVCYYDYLEIYDGEDDLAPLLGRYCGKMRPFQIQGSSNNITIKFTTDASINHAGFHLTIFWGCPSSISGSSGNFSSPNYPSNYPNILRCSWRITVPSGFRVEVKFNTFETEDSYDYLRIYNGSLSSSSQLASLTGNLSTPRTYLSSGSSLRLNFVTDGNVTTKGIHASYRAILSSRCPSSATGSYGDFVSPNYPDNYLNNLNCSWRITVPSGYRVQVEFDTFETEIMFDYLRIYNGPSSSSPQLTWLTGSSSKPRTLFSSGSSLWFNFVTDGSLTRKGFRASHTATLFSG